MAETLSQRAVGHGFVFESEILVASHKRSKPLREEIPESFSKRCLRILVQEYGGERVQAWLDEMRSGGRSKET